MARSTSRETVNEAPLEWLAPGLGPEDGEGVRPLPMLLLALLVHEREETLRLRLGPALFSNLQVDDEIEFPRPETPTH